MKNENVINKFQEIIDVCKQCQDSNNYEELKEDIFYFNNIYSELFNFVRAEEARENKENMTYSNKLVELEITSSFFPKLWEGKTEDGHIFSARFKRDLFFAEIDDVEIFRKDKIFYEDDLDAMPTEDMLSLVGFTTTEEVLTKCKEKESHRFDVDIKALEEVWGNKEQNKL